MVAQAGEQPGVGHLSPQHQEDGGWHKQCSPSPSGSRAGRPGVKGAGGTGLPCMADFPQAMVNKALHPAVGQFALREMRVWSMKSLYSGMSPASPHACLIQWGGLALTQTEGPRPLPDTHLTPVEPLFFSFKVKSLSLIARVKAWPCRWAPGDS